MDIFPVLWVQELKAVDEMDEEGWERTGRLRGLPMLQESQDAIKSEVEA